jgi:hypothetical protein
VRQNGKDEVGGRATLAGSPAFSSWWAPGRVDLAAAALGPMELRQTVEGVLAHVWENTLLSLFSLVLPNWSLLHGT